MMDNTQLIAEARNWLRTHPNTHSARKLDVKRLSNALEAADAELIRRQAVIDEARTANHFSPIKNYRVEKILTRESTDSTNRSIMSEIIPTVEEFIAQMDAEQKKANAKGYTDDHDREHGADHLLKWAIEYARIRKPAASANLIRAARRVLQLADPTPHMENRVSGPSDSGKR